MKPLTLFRRPGVANGARRAHASCLVAADATRHRGYGSRFRHGVEVAHCPVAGFALHPRLQVLAMGPSDPWQYLVNAHPRNRLFRFGVVRELFDRRPIGDHRRMAVHAGRGGWKRHLLTGRRAGVTELARQSHAEVGLVTVRQRLLGSGCGARLVRTAVASGTGGCACAVPTVNQANAVIIAAISKRLFIVAFTRVRSSWRIESFRRPARFQ